MKTLTTVLTCLGLILVLPGNTFIVHSAEAAIGTTVTFFEGFEDDFIAGRNVPDLVDASLSSPFSGINEKRPEASGKLTLRDRDISDEGGEGGGFPPLNNVVLDFSDGGGTFVTFRFSPGCVVGPGSTITFDVVAYGSDDGSLFKFVSSDGMNFTQVGDDSDENGPFTFDLATGGTETFFRLQVGTMADIWDGVHVDNFQAVINCPSVQQIKIDIKPGSDPNSINCKNKKGVIPVAILTTEGFDATMVDHTTVIFEGARETHVDKKSSEPRRHEGDVDGDGDTDLMFHFRMGDTNLTCDSTEGTLIGETFDGQAIESTDAVRMVQGGGKP